MFVLTSDQRRSTEHGDKVDALLASLEPWVAEWADAVALPPERTVGDEIQAVLTTPDAAVDLALRLMREQEWSVGIGAGPVDEPLRDTARASSGPAFISAREAVERARGRAEPVPLVVAGADAEAAAQATGVLQLIAAVVRRRSPQGWEVADLWSPDVVQRDIAQRLGISTQAVSQRVSSAMLEEEFGVRPVAARLLSEAERERGAS